MSKAQQLIGLVKRGQEKTAGNCIGKFYSQSANGTCTACYVGTLLLGMEIPVATILEIENEEAGFDDLEYIAYLVNQKTGIRIAYDSLVEMIIRSDRFVPYDDIHEFLIQRESTGDLEE